MRGSEGRAAGTPRGAVDLHLRRGSEGAYPYVKYGSVGNWVAKCFRSGHSAPMTFTGIYATDMGSAHVGTVACPVEQPSLAWLPGRPSESNTTRRDRQPQAA